MKGIQNIIKQKDLKTKKTRILLIDILIFASMIIFIQCQKPGPQEEKTFAVTSVKFGELGWGKNNLTVKARNLSRGSRKLILTINTRYLNGGRWLPNQNSIEFNFKPMEEKEVSRYFYIRPDHGTLEIRLLIQSQSEAKLQETILYKKHQFEFEAPNDRIHQLEFPYPEKIGLEKEAYPAFKFSANKHFIFYYLPNSEEEKNINNILADWEKSLSHLKKEFKANIPEKIIVFLLPDSSSSMMTLLHPGGRLISNNTMIITDGKDYDSKQNLRSFFSVSSLLANRASDFWATIGGRGDDGLNYRPLRLKVVLCLYEGLNIDDIAERLELPKSQIREVIDELEEITIVKREEEKYKPNILIITKEEFQHLITKVDTNALAVAQLIETNWKQVKRTYDQLSFANIFPIKRTGFHLIGSLLLESGMLDLFFKDRTLVSPYPLRPRKNDPEASTRRRFYCVLIEGREFFKRIYGLSDRGYIDRPKVITYGRYADNLPRRMFDRNLRILIELSGGKDKFISDFLPEYRNKLNNNKYTSSTSSIDSLLDDFPYRIPAYNHEDMIKVKQLISDLGAEILDYFKNNRKDLESVFQSLKGKEFSSFSEFFYFYYHFVFCQTTNYLAERGLFSIPEYTFDYWMQEGPIFNLENLSE